MSFSSSVRNHLKLRQVLINIISVAMLGFPASSYIFGQNKVENVLESPRIVKLKKQLESGDRAVLDEFWADVAKQGTPLVERIEGDNINVLMTFLWHGAPETKNVWIASQLNKMDTPRNLMTRLLDSDVWYKTYKIRDDARFAYVLSPNDPFVSQSKLDEKDWEKRTANLRKDPLNPKTTMSYIESSVVELPGALPQPWVVAKPGTRVGKAEKFRLKSRILNNERDVWVYTPPGYKQGNKKLPLLVMLEGQTFTAQIPTPTILDNLQTNSEIPPLIAVFVEPVDFFKELSCNPNYADFLSAELIPWMRSRYNITSRPDRTIVGGASLSGLAAAYAALRHPENFGNVISLSGSFWYKPEGDTDSEWLTRQFATTPKLRRHFYLEVGLLENLPLEHIDDVTMLLVTRHLRDVLQAKGYTVGYKEFNGGHEEINWQGGIARGLKTLLNQ